MNLKNAKPFYCLIGFSLLGAFAGISGEGNAEIDETYVANERVYISQ